MEMETTGRTELPPPGGLMTAREAGAELGVSHETIHRMIKNGAFRVYWPTPRRMWVFKRDVMKHKRASVKVAS